MLDAIRTPVTNWRKSFLIVPSVLLLMFSAGCRGTEPPVCVLQIKNITAKPARLGYGETTRLTVTASDADNCQLTYQWTTAGGSFDGPTNTKTVTWVAPDRSNTYKVKVTVRGPERNVTGDVDMQVLTFYDDFAGDLRKWMTRYCNAWIVNEEAHYVGTSSSYAAQLRTDFDPPIPPPYAVRMSMARVANFSSTEGYGLFTSINDAGSVRITSFGFIIRPSDAKENWRIIAFLVPAYKWVLLDSDSRGKSPLIKTGANQWNVVEWKVEADKTIAVRIGNSLLYQSNVIRKIENDFGIVIGMDLTHIAARTDALKKEVKIDNVSVFAPGTSIAVSSGALSNAFDPSETTAIDNQMMSAGPESGIRLRTLKEVLAELE